MFEHSLLHTAKVKRKITRWRAIHTYYLGRISVCEDGMQSYNFVKYLYSMLEYPPGLMLPYISKVPYSVCIACALAVEKNETLHVLYVEKH